MGYKVSNIYAITAIAVIGGGLFGFDISSMSAILGTQAYKCYFNQGGVNSQGQCSGPTAAVQGGITAAMPAGSWLGSLISGYLSDILGRRPSIMVGCVLWVIGSTIVCASVDIPMLIVGRIINGLAVGIESSQVPVYISEIAPPTKRGRLIGAQQWSITFGILILYYISYGASFIGGQTNDTYSTAVFRVPWGVQMVPAFLLFGAMIFMVESPRWLAREDRWEECHAVLTLVHGHGDPDNPFVMYELNDIKEMCRLEAQHADVTYWELFGPTMIFRTHVGIMCQVWSQLTGMNVMMYYISYIFAMAGYQGNANLLASSIQYVINVVMTVPALIWMDRWGRRPTMIVGAFFMMVFMFANAGLLGGYGVPVPGGIGGVPEESMRITGAPAKGLIACTYLFVASYAPTWGPVSWTYPPELYPLRVRGKAVAMSTSANWVFNTALGAFTPPAFENIKYKVYIIFGVFNLAMMIHSALLFPETAGKTLEDTAYMFEDTTPGESLPYIGTKPWKTKVQFQSIARIERGEVTVDKLDSVGGVHDSSDEKAYEA